MKSPASNPPPKRLVAKKKQFRLDLRRSKPAPPQEPDIEPKSRFWLWVALVALFHLIALGIFGIIYSRSEPTPPPPEQFISLVPAGDVVKGTPGTQEAKKIGDTTPAPSAKHSTPVPQPPPPKAVKISKPAPVVPKVATPPKPIVKDDVAALVPDKPEPKPTPVKPKVKVDLSQLVDGPTSEVTPVKPAKTKPVKPKKHVAEKPTDDSTAPERDADSAPDNTGLSAAEVAKKLGDKLQSSGVKDATKSGPNGSSHSQASPFADFYLSIHDQVMSKWQHPNISDETAVAPEVQIHVEKDGRVPAEGVTLIHSSGNAAYDESALAAARALGYTLQPLPDGCPPDISITFNLTH